MDVIDAICGRRSIRLFKEKDVPEKMITKLISLAVMAPSAGNLQAWDLIIIRNLETKDALVRAAFGQSFIAKAPIIIVVCANQKRSAQQYGTRGTNLYSIQDSAAAIQNLLLAAYSLGLGTCWVGAFNESLVSDLLKIPDGVRPVSIIPVGYNLNDTNSQPPNRLPLEQILHNEQF